MCFSCKNKNTSETVFVDETRNLTEVDTFFCNQKLYDQIETNDISLYNSNYQSTINTHSVNAKKIIYVQNNKNHICYERASNLILLKGDDSIYNVIIDIPLIRKEYEDFYKKYLEAKKNNNLGKEHKIPKPLENINLDSINLRGARSNYIYFTAYLDEYKKQEKYKIDIGVGFKDEKKGKFLINQLQKVRQ